MFQSAQIAEYSEYSCLYRHKSKKYAHVTPILKQLHWLPVKYRCIFKTATLVYTFLHSGFPSYFEPFEPRCLLGMTWLCHWINVNSLVLCSDAP